MQISFLAEFPEFIPILAPPIAKHWSSIMGDKIPDIEGRMVKLQKHMNTNTLPIAWVAHADDQVFGTAALRVHDLEDRPDLTPWLAGVFVLQPFRGRGVASALCQIAENCAWSLGFENLFLFTLDQQSLYTRLGWKKMEHSTWRGREVDIMIKGKPSSRHGRDV